MSLYASIETLTVGAVVLAAAVGATARWWRPWLGRASAAGGHCGSGASGAGCSSCGQCGSGGGSSTAPVNTDLLRELRKPSGAPKA